MSQSRADLLTENIALREEIEQLRAAIVLWRDLYELISTRCVDRSAQTPGENRPSAPPKQELAIIEACGPGFQHLASICIEEGVSLKASTRIADCVRTMQATMLSDAARLFTDAAATKDGWSKS